MIEVEDLSGRTLGEFVLRARIDEGGFGAVYRSEQRSLGRDAVVKVLHPRLRSNDVVLQRFMREAQLASRLDHPCAAHVYAFGIEPDDGLFWIAMELVHGTPLHRWLRDRGPMSLPAFVPFFEQLADVVHAAHERGIVHRDLKPSNVMVIERGGRLMPKLLDFGVAKVLDPERSQAIASGAPSRRLRPSGSLPSPAAPAVERQAMTVQAQRGHRSLDDVTRTASSTPAPGSDQRRLTHVDSTVGSPPYMSPEQWTNAVEVGPPSDLYALAVVAYEALTGRRPFVAERRAEYAELHCEAPVPPVGTRLPTALDRFFARALAKRPEDRWGTALALAAALRAEWIIAGRAGGTVVTGGGDAAATRSDDAASAETAPYLGLAPYAPSDAARYVGREAEAAALIDRLHHGPLQVVVGPSGAGKSSFVHAGVVSQLPSAWRAVTLRPGAAPLAALAFRLEAAVGAGDGGGLRELLATSPAAAAARVVAAAAGGVIVVVIDQLEELFTLCGSAEERGQFAAAIAQLAASADLPVRVIATIRDDFLMRLDGLSALRPLLSSALVLLGNPLLEDLVRIVVEPAMRAGYALSDPELAGDMVAAVENRSGALAVLSFTALQLWELRDPKSRQLTRSAYDAMGGVAGALARHAEATFEALSGDEQRLAREVFRHLVTADGTRAQLTAAELCQRLALPGTEIAAEAVLDKLVAARLLTAADVVGLDGGGREAHIELVHEALIEGWPRLQGWLREDIDGARMREQLRVAARQWSDRGRPRGLLWRDDVLVDLRRWLRNAPAVRLGDLERAFVAANLQAVRRGRLRRVLGLIAVGFAIAAAIFVYSWMRSTIGRRAAEQRVTEMYADRGRIALLDGKRTEALAYLTQAVRRGDDSAAIKFMFERAAEPRLREVGRMTSTSPQMWSATFSPDGRWIVTTDNVGASIWDARSFHLVFTMPCGRSAPSAVFALAGRVFVTACDDGVLRSWDIDTGRLRSSSAAPTTNGTPPEFSSLAVSPNGNEVAAVEMHGELVYVWSLLTGAVVVKRIRQESEPYYPSLQYSYDGNWIAANCGGKVYIYDTQTWNLVTTIVGPQISTLSFDPTGPRLATASLNGDVSVWTIPEGLRTHHLHDAPAKFAHVAFSLDGEHIAASDREGMDRVWSAHDGQPQLELHNHSNVTPWIEFDSSSTLVASASDSDVVISDLVRGVKITTLDGPRVSVRNVHFGPIGDRVVAASWDGTARVWNAHAQYLQWSVPSSGEECSSLGTVTVQQRFIVVICREHWTRIWDTTRQQMIAELPGPTPMPDLPELSAAVVSADGDRAAVAIGSRVDVYSLPEGSLLRSIPHSDTVTTVAFSPAGHDLVSGGRDGVLCTTRDGESPVELPKMSAAILAVTFISDDRVAAADHNRVVRIYDRRDRAMLATMNGESVVSAFRVSPDGRRLLAFAPSESAAPPVLYDMQHIRRVARLDGNPAVVFSARFVRGGSEILTASNDGIARLWDSTTGRLRDAFIGGSQYIIDGAVDAGGALLATAGGDGVVRFWDVASASLLWTMPAHNAAVTGIHFDGHDVVTRSLLGAIARWRLPELPAAPAFHAQVDRVARCLPLRVDDATGRLIEQSPSCE